MHLSQTSLIGPRPPIPRNFVLLRDDSGSFVDYEAIRDDSIQQVLTWAPGNLRDDDTITVISFAGESLVTLPPTTVADLIDSKTEPIREVATGDDTQIIPALQATRDVLKEHPHPTSIIIITDTLIHDVTSGQVDDLLGELSVMSLSVILPTGMSVDPTWSTQFDWAADFHAEPGDSASTALAVGEALAHATGQALQSS
ncbi:MAG: VWA domain-containing protein [Propionibacteriaceae bacterium]|nr:VWA domain-containing protein [Propionibacteriaceae bacterium]